MLYIGLMVDGESAEPMTLAVGDTVADVQESFVNWAVSFAQLQGNDMRRTILPLTEEETGEVGEPVVLDPITMEETSDRVWYELIANFVIGNRKRPKNPVEREARWENTREFLLNCFFVWKIWKTDFGVMIPIWLPEPGQMQEFNHLEVFDCTVDENVRMRRSV